MIAERRRRGHRLAVDAAAPAGGSSLEARGIDAGAERGKPKGAFDLGGDRPRAVALIVGDIFESGAAQTAPRRQKRDRLDAIRLSGAVRAYQRHHVTARLKARRAIVAEVREREAVNAGGGHGYLSLPGLTRRPTCLLQDVDGRDEPGHNAI